MLQTEVTEYDDVLSGYQPGQTSSYSVARKATNLRSHRV